MPNAHRRYILAQGPLPHTTDHFWLMIWEQNCKAVVMLNRVIEKNQVNQSLLDNMIKTFYYDNYSVSTNTNKY